MEMQYSAELIGAENIKKLIDKFPKLREKAKSVLATNSYFLQWKSQEKCPVDTGTLKRFGKLDFGKEYFREPKFGKAEAFIYNLCFFSFFSSLTDCVD